MLRFVFATYFFFNNTHFNNKAPTNGRNSFVRLHLMLFNKWWTNTATSLLYTEWTKQHSISSQNCIIIITFLLLLFDLIRVRDSEWIQIT